VSRRVTLRTEDVQCMLSSTEVAQGHGHVEGVCGVLRNYAMHLKLVSQQSMMAHIRTSKYRCRPHDCLKTSSKDVGRLRRVSVDLHICANEAVSRRLFENEKRRNREKAESFAVCEGFVMHRSTGDKLCRVIVDPSEEERILSSLHADIHSHYVFCSACRGFVIY